MFTFSPSGPVCLILNSRSISIAMKYVDRKVRILLLERVKLMMIFVYIESLRILLGTKVLGDSRCYLGSSSVPIWNFGIPLMKKEQWQYLKYMRHQLKKVYFLEIWKHFAKLEELSQHTEVGIGQLTLKLLT